ncbi:MAG: ABC transporter permease subunit, partial [Propionibacteriaceae bacterium]|nr:ABC transporter permease subunit [Propionibacteriaceae bacterium]
MTDSETGRAVRPRGFRLSDVRPTVRRRISRGSSYAVALIIVVVIVVKTDWPKIQRNFFNGQVAEQLVPAIFRALGNTLLYTLVCFVVGTVLAAVFALMKMSHGPARWFAIGYIELFRGLPALLTIFAFAFMIPIAFKARVPGGPLGGGLLALIIVTSAYNAEVIRSGIEAVPKGQREAARSLGMPH